MYAIDCSQQNKYCNQTPPRTMYAAGFRNKAINGTNISSTTQYRHLDSNAYNHGISTTQEGHYVTSAHYNTIITTHDRRFCKIESNNYIVAADYNHSTQEQKYSLHNHVGASTSIGECGSAGSSLSRLLDDVMSIDTFPCMLVPLLAEDKIVNWLDIPLEITCIHTKNSSIDNEEISMSNDFLMDTTTQDSSRMSLQLLTPASTVVRRQNHWHFDIESVENDDISVDTVKTWSLSEDFS
jgi:hypothetical protein